MNEKVEEFLNKCKKERSLAENAYRYLVKEYAGILKDERGYMEVGKSEYEQVAAMDADKVKEVNGKYYVFRKLPIDLTEEEFSAVEKEIPEDTLNALKQKAAGTADKKEKNLAVTIFVTLAWIFWIGGLIIALLGSFTMGKIINNYTYMSEGYSFSFTAFLSTFFSYLPYGAVCLLFAALCNRFQMDLKHKKGE